MKKSILSNIGLKALAVFLAISTWFFVTYRGQAEMSIETPIGFKNVPRGLELVRESVKNVSLSLRGHERLLKSLRPIDVGVVIDLSNARKGDSAYYFDKDSVIVPRTVEVLRIEPTSVKVLLDESVTKVIPVKAAVIGTPEKGFRITSIDVKPSSVAVEGAKTELARIAVLRTEPIDAAGLDSNIIQSVKLNTNGRNIRTKIPEVTVSITIKRLGK
ncbi:MAG: CdaR family protein [Nitrospirae bacterium]|nr:CdaR family protein [Nitrospirota bacterium]MCL5236761.1 CdaR family protein [Nitrospirota bacterium]